jgi:hypothetical protein
MSPLAASIRHYQEDCQGVGSAKSGDRLWSLGIRSKYGRVMGESEFWNWFFPRWKVWVELPIFPITAPTGVPFSASTVSEALHNGAW